ncbi:MAG: glycosyltransferase family 39 protein [Candidatus Binatia bacterium]
MPSISLGSGRSEIVEYDSALRPVRRYTGVQNPVDIAPTADGGFLFVDVGTKQVTAVAPDGAVRWSDGIGGYPLRVRTRPGGGLLVTAADKVVGLRPDRSVEFEIDVPRVVAAAPLPNGNLVVAYNDRQGWLAEMTPRGDVVRRTAPSGRVDEWGLWVNESPQAYFISVSSVDVGPDGSIFAANFDSSDVRLLTPELGLRQSIPGFVHATDTRLGPNGELVVVAPEQWRVWIRDRDGTEREFEPSLVPRCASLTSTGTLLVGVWWTAEGEVLNAAKPQADKAEVVPWWQRGLPVPALALLLSALVAYPMRRREIAARVWRRTADGEPASEDATPPPGGTPPRGRAGVAARFACAALLGCGALLMWTGTERLYAQQLADGTQRFLVGALLAGLALRGLNALTSPATALSSLDPLAWRPLPPRGDRIRTLALLVLSFAALAGCVTAVLYGAETQAVAVGCWIAAQVWILAAAFPPRAADAEEPATPRWRHAAVAMLLLGTLISRLWEIGFYPDNVHHDHNLYGTAVLSLVRGDWRPFFIMDPHSLTFARPWLVPAAAAVELFGPSYWVLRLTAALSSTLMVWGSILFAGALFNWRVGLIAGFLVAVNHALFLYSRQPYVIESTAPFFLLLYCALTGARRGSRFHWCLAGVIAGWAMLSPRQSSMFPFICAAIFAYAAMLYTRAVARQWRGILWMIAGAAVTYVPLVPYMLAHPLLWHRLQDTAVLFKPDYSIVRDWAVWQHQLVRSYGSIILYPDASMWGLYTGKPLCLQVEACLFGAGLVYLLTSPRSLAGFAVLATIAISIFLGSALLVSPPTVYHYFVGVIGALVVCAVALDRAAALFERLSRPLPLASGLLVVAVLGQIALAHAASVWPVLQRRDGDRGQALRAHPTDVVVRFIREHPEPRYYLVRSRRDASSTGPQFLYAAADSDVSDVSNALRDVLPLPSVDPAPAAVFVVMPSRSDDRQVISEIYPGARAREVPLWDGVSSLWIYAVSADEIRSKAPPEVIANPTR